MTVDTPHNEKDIAVEDLENLDFDEWKTLFEENPEQFDKYRIRMLEHQIELAPEGSRQRLRGLMFQMECESKKSRTPQSYNQRLYSMMMAQFDELREKLQLLCYADANVVTEKLNNESSATVLAFERRAKTLQTEI